MNISGLSLRREQHRQQVIWNRLKTASRRNPPGGILEKQVNSNLMRFGFGRFSKAHSMIGPRKNMTSTVPKYDELNLILKHRYSLIILCGFG